MLDRNLASEEMPLLNGIETYEPEAGRTDADNKNQIFNANGILLLQRTHMSRDRFQYIFRATMQYVTSVERLLYQNVQKGEKPKQELIDTMENYVRRNFHSEMSDDNDFRVMMDSLKNATLKYYVLQPMIDNDDVSDIKVCGPKDIRVRVKGAAMQSNASFIDEEDLFRFVEGIAFRNHIQFESMNPVITFTDTHDENYILRFTLSHPVINAVNNPYFHIRKVPKTKPDYDELIRRGMLPEKVKLYLIDKAKSSHGIAFAGPPGCVSGDTEYFDGTGWKKMSEYDGGSVLQYDTKTGQASLVKPLRYIKEPCNEMYHFKTSRGIDQMLSPEHRVIYYNRTHKENVKLWSETAMEMSAEELAEKLDAGKFWGGFKTTFLYDGEGLPLSDAEIKLMLAVICDGHFARNTARCTIRLKKQRKKEALTDILNEVGIMFDRYDTQNGYSSFRFTAPRREKEFSAWWYGASACQLSLICANVLQWDGHVDNIGRWTFSTVSRISADFIQFAFSACGYRSTIKLDARAGETYMTCGKEYVRKSNCYTICISDQPIVAMGYHRPGMGSAPKAEKVVPPDGYKYCFTVPTHALVLRRNGRIFITGNSGKSTLLNAFIEYIPRTRETLVIQENDELFTNQPGFMFKHVTHGIMRGEPLCTLEDLGRMALVEGCNEFVVGEAKGAEMRAVATLMNAGGYGALTVHATSAREIIDKLADLVKYGSTYSFDEARRMLKVFDTLVYMEGYKVREILEVKRYDDDTKRFEYYPIYRYVPPQS